MLGYNGDLDGAFPRGGDHKGSLALFNPEEGTWKSNVNKLFNTADARGEKAYEAMRKTFENERNTWVNVAGDPSDVSSTTWRGFSGCIVEATTIDGFPFISNFNVGNGKHRFFDGQRLGTRDWSHSGMQSYLPTWRWWIENGDGLKESIDWDDAYAGGNSMLISGNLSSGDHLVLLFKMAAKCDGGKARLVYKSNNTVAPTLRLSTTSSVNPDVELTATVTTVNGWSVAEYDLTSVAGKPVYMAGVNLKAAGAIANYEMHLGQLAIIPDGYAPAAASISNLKVEKALGEEGGDLRITWDWTENADVDYFNVYTVDHKNVRTLVGQTRDEGFYVPEVKREGKESGIGIEVVAVMKDGREGAKETMTAEYPKAQLPKPKVVNGKSYLKVGETTTISATSEDKTTACKWILPEGLEFADGSKENDYEIKVKATAAGRKIAKVELTNEAGTGSVEGFVADVLSDEEYAEVKNVVLGKKSTEASTTMYGGPELLVDGNNTSNSILDKWSSRGDSPYASFDLGDIYQIYGFGIYDLNNGSGYKNFDKYRIYISQDGSEWTEMVNRTGRVGDEIKYDYLMPCAARYVKLNPYGLGAFGSVAVTEFEVYGRESAAINFDGPKEITAYSGEAVGVTVAYDLKGAAHSDDFDYNVVAGGNLSVSNVKDDAAKSEITFDVVAERVFGHSKLTVKVNNGGGWREFGIDVDIDVPDAESAIKGLPVEVRKYSANYSEDAAYTPTSVGTLTDGNTEKETLEEACPDASLYEYDVWAVADAGKTLNISKIKAYIPASNYGINANDVEGIVNKEIAFKVSDDGKIWKDVKVFTGLGRESSLTCILPSFVEARYVAVACNVNPYFYGSLAEVEVFEQIADRIPVTRAIAIKSGYNYDVIAEASDIKSATTGALDGEGWVLYTEDVRASGSIPAIDGMITSSTSIPYQLGSYDKPNGMTLSKSESGTLEFEQPVNAEKLYLLTISADGSGKANVTVNYEDGSKESVQTIVTTDWYASYDNGYAVYGLGRVNRAGMNFDTRNYFLMTEATIEANVSKKAVSVTVDNTSSNRPTVLAVSMTGINSTSGIDDVATDGVDGEVAGIYNLQGVRVENPGRGIHIVVYSDGTTKKVLFR
ncbi:discoidin domain-containing protein [uncultured Muribaculum sp.]|uniref:discoidin domain-containing protein n=1 Tax=uncultured Muribaculum sp. TaxID=1918613 RepID=UPI002610EF71|nr:discoidin domain-containing protein [uncultured Muribaculum sp.]